MRPSLNITGEFYSDSNNDENRKIADEIFIISANPANERVFFAYIFHRLNTALIQAFGYYIQGGW